MFVGSTLIIPAVWYASFPSDCWRISPWGCEEQHPACVNSDISSATEAPNDHFQALQAARDLIWSVCVCVIGKGAFSTNTQVLLFHKLAYAWIIIPKDVMTCLPDWITSFLSFIYIRSISAHSQADTHALNTNLVYVYLFVFLPLCVMHSILFDFFSPLFTN